jgi:Family of unknown function (DUF6130)
MDEKGKHMRIRNLALVAVAAVTLVACRGGGDDSGSSSPSAPPIARPSSTAELTVISPGNGEIVHGSTVELRVDLQGAKIVPQTTMDIAPDEGHLHVLLDDELISMTGKTEQRIPDVTAGAHRFTVEFVAADHAPFDPRVVAVVVFEVKT